MKRVILVLLGVVMSLAVTSKAYSADNNQKRSRMEELFAWMVTDRLQLAPETEAQFTAALKKLSVDKAKASEHLESLANDLEKEKTPEKLSAKIEEYKKAVENLARLQGEEVTTMQKLLGDQKLAQYVALKRQLAEKVKTLLSQPNNSVPGPAPAAKAPSQEPKVIEEK